MKRLPRISPPCTSKRLTFTLSLSCILLLCIALSLTACAARENADATPAQASLPAGDEPYLAWNDSIKAMGMRGDIDGVRTVLTAFQQACLDGTASADAEKAKKSLYVAWSNVVSFLFNKGDILDAIDEVQAMQKYAQQTDDEFGMAMVELSYGGLYTYSFKESIDHLRRALSYWEKSGNVPQTQYTLYMLSRELLGEAENTDPEALDPTIYAEVLNNSDRIEYLDSANTYMKQVSEYQRLMTHVARKDRAAATKSYDKVNAWWQNGEITPQLRGMMANTMAQYLITFSDPALATPLLDEINLRLYRLQTERLQAMAMEDYQRACQLQTEIDKINIQRINQLQQTQLAIANAAFHNLQLERDNHTLDLERMRKQRQLVVISIVALALLVVIIVLLIYQRGMNRKNVELVQRIKALEDEEQKTISLATRNEESLTAEEKLFMRIEQLLKDQTVLTNPELDRDMIATLLGTNRTYVVRAISECTEGKSVSGYINELRVRLGRRMLEDQQKSIKEIVYDCGFSSRSHFHNQFLSEYGMTPAQFQKALKKL